jgi:nickel transport protein
MKCCAALLGLLLTPGLALAHDFWLEPANDGLILRYGHRGVELLAIEAGKVKAIRCIDKGIAKDVLSSATFTPREVRVSAHCDAASAFYYGGFFSLTPDGEVPLPKNEARHAVKAWESKQFAKWVDSLSNQADSILGDEFEMVPVSDIAHAHQGDKISVRVLLQGKPVSGAIVAIDDKPIGETDSAGETRVRIRASDIELISASLRRSVSTPEADAVVFEASLSFAVAK